ncbi:MAG: c-type cytochrome [Herpetosiphonaceae bacterium]|nr:c-type cytochrome [Herpetosiphonaceae bacterium]
MTRNVLLATLFTLGTAIALLVIFLGEKTTRMPAASAAVNATQIERGARDYEQYCSRCHGLAGQGGANETGAPQLNNIVQRKMALQDPKDLNSSDYGRQYGIKEKYGTIRNYIIATLISGIRGAAMPAWGQQAGGPLRQDQIENIASYVLSWNGDVPSSTVALAGTVAAASLPTADPGATPFGGGKVLFQTKGCVGCHNTSNVTLVGPGLGGLFDPGGTEAYGTNLPNGNPVNEANVLDWIRKATGGFPQKHVGLNTNVNLAANLANGVMPPIAITDAEYTKLLVYLKAYGRDGKIKPGADAAAPGVKAGTLKPTPATTPQPAASAAANQPASGGISQPASSATSVSGTSQVVPQATGTTTP